MESLKPSQWHRKHKQQDESREQTLSRVTTELLDLCIRKLDQKEPAQ